MKITMVSHYFEEHRGGVEIVAGALAQRLASRGFKLSWLATGERQNVTGDVARIDLRAWNVLEARAGLPYPILHPSACVLIFQNVRASDIVLVHDGIYLTSIVAGLAARVHRKPLVVVQHIGEVPYRSMALRFLMRLANRMFSATMLTVADRVVFISSLTQNHFRGLKFRRQPERIYNGIETKVFHPTPGLEKSNHRCALDLPVDARIVLFVGRFVEKKGLHIIERMARNAPHLLFVFAGWGPMDPAQWGLPNVRVFRNLSGKTLAPLYQASDVLLLPSVGEGFPLVIQEALACGLPVVCGADTAMADPAASALVKGVELDVPVEVASAAVGAAVEAALSETDTHGASQIRADFAARHYSWDSVIDRYEGLLTSLTKAKPAPFSAGGSAR